MRVNAMIRRMQFTDLDKVSQIWLESNKEAHGFIPAEYWESHLQSVKTALLQAEGCAQKAFAHFPPQSSL